MVENMKFFSKLKKELGVKVLGMALCPHLLKRSKRSHTQRMSLTLKMNVAWDFKVSFLEMIDTCESCFSSENYNLLKFVDEAHLVDKAFKNPKFVEDVVKKCVKKSLNLGIKGKINVKVRSLESIKKFRFKSTVTKFCFNFETL